MINWKPFSTAPKDRVIYAYHNVIGIRKIKWEEWPNVYQKTPNWLTLPNDAWDNEKTFSKQYYSSWTHWCEVNEIVPPRISIIPIDVGKAFRRRSRAVTKISDNYSKDFAEF